MAVLAITAAVCLVTANAPGGEFVLDDTSKIVDNTDIRRLEALPSTLIYPYGRNQLLERNDPSRTLVFVNYGLIDHAFELNPSHVLAHSNLGLIYFRQGRREDARRCEDALRRDPINARIRQKYDELLRTKPRK